MELSRVISVTEEHLDDMEGKLVAFTGDGSVVVQLTPGLEFSNRKTFFKFVNELTAAKEDWDHKTNFDI